MANANESVATIFCEMEDEIHRLRAKLAKRDWISVEDRQPTKCDFYWCANADGGAWLYMWNPKSGWWEEENGGERVADQKYITHWMPLPEPPK